MSTGDVIIIGAGPAGIATAIQLKRYGIEPVVFEQEEIGGLLRNAKMVENYPGFPDGISGLDLVELFERQLNNAEVKVRSERVLKLDYQEKIFHVETDEGVFISAIAVIASGTKPKRISDFRIQDEVKDRIFYEIHPIREIQNKRIVIIGSGDAAFDYALGLSQENEVVILNRNKKDKCIPVLKKKCMESERVSYSRGINVKEINRGDNKLLLTCINRDHQNKEKISADYVIVAVGREPCLDFLGSRLKRNLKELIEQDILYFVGDVKNEQYRQTAICVGDGIRAAMKISEKVRGVNT